MVTQEKAKEHYLNMYKIGSIYVWGFNSGTIITQASIDKAYALYHTSRYNRSYYNAKLEEGRGKNGSDCSGAHFPISGYDTTAQHYYERCTKKGTMKNLPKDKLVLLFRGSSTQSIVHTGVYIPNVGAFHMASSARNAVLEPVEDHAWTYWGYADFISDYDTYSFKDDSKKPEPKPEKYTQEQFLYDVQHILNVTNPKTALKETVTISLTSNANHKLVTPLERYMKALGYYNGSIEEDKGKEPKFGEGMAKAIKQYQKEIVKASEKNQDGILTKKGATWKKLLGFT